MFSYGWAGYSTGGDTSIDDLRISSHPFLPLPRGPRDPHDPQQQEKQFDARRTAASFLKQASNLPTSCAFLSRNNRLLV